jgi:ribose transport system ATP-binding protein
MPAALELRDLSKQFGGVPALDSVSLVVPQGEVVGLLGQNGCGKSTLVKILAGYHAPEPGGKLFIGGEEVALPLAAGQFRELGLSFVFQDLGLVPELTVLENLSIGDRIPGSIPNRRYISWRGERREWAARLRSYGVDLDLDSAVRDLPPVGRAILAIVRAAEELRAFRLRTGSSFSVLVLDEPTVFLPRSELGFLFDLIRAVVADGASVIFISHDLPAVHELAKSVTVFRDGRLVGTERVSDLTVDDMVELITGHKAPEKAQPGAFDESAAPQSGEPVLEVVGLTSDTLTDLHVEVHAGEIVGVAGLLGSGVDDLPYVLFGAQPSTAGTISVGGRRRDASRVTPTTSISDGLGLVPADRRQLGGLLGLAVTDNLFMLTISRYFLGGAIRRRAMRRAADDLVSRFRVKLRDPEIEFGSLSGGNQQKVVLAKWLEIGPKVLMLHEPTQGVDVGAREEIYRLVREAVAAGAGVVWITTDLDELANMSDRILLMVDGRVDRELRPPHLDKEAIASAIYSSSIRG